LTFILSLTGIESTWDVCSDNNVLLRTYPLPQSLDIKIIARHKDCASAAQEGACDWNDDRSVYLFPWRRACPKSCGVCEEVEGIGSMWSPASKFEMTSPMSAAGLDLGDDDADCDLARILYSDHANDSYIQEHFVDAEIPVIVQGLVTEWDLVRWVKGAVEEVEGVLPPLLPQPSYFLQQELRRVQHIGYNQYGDLSNYPKDSKLREVLKTGYRPPWELLGGKDYIRSGCNQTSGTPQWHHRWILVAGEGTSSAWHVDQFNTTAWNTVLHGRKRWMLFPPSDAPPDMRPYLDMNGVPQAVDMSSYDYFGEQRSPWGDEMPWSLTGSKLAKQHAVYFRKLHGKKLPPQMLQCMLRTNETLILPSGWWHAVLNT
jgi:hypothetical protein